ncbi:hypothetical protein [Actinoplanes sp. NPDC020271]|uniref:hypothetical protein n=1 Tax=Actinoplanes sp. NPDC020271 TaxID=3363896 RepID=UPI0037B93878
MGNGQQRKTGSSKKRAGATNKPPAAPKSQAQIPDPKLNTPPLRTPAEKKPSKWKEPALWISVLALVVSASSSVWAYMAGDLAKKNHERRYVNRVFWSDVGPKDDKGGPYLYLQNRSQGELRDVVLRTTLVRSLEFDLSPSPSSTPTVPGGPASRGVSYSIPNVPPCRELLVRAPGGVDTKRYFRILDAIVFTDADKQRWSKSYSGDTSRVQEPAKGTDVEPDLEAVVEVLSRQELDAEPGEEELRNCTDS